MTAISLSHTYMPFDRPEQSEVDSFLPAFAPKHFLDPENPGNFNTVTLPDIRPGVDGVMPPGISKSATICIRTFGRLLTPMRRSTGTSKKEFGRGGNPLIEEYRCDDADFVAVAIGSLSYQLRDVIDIMREKD